MIEYIESKYPAYTARTEENASIADITVALAFDLNTAGERATRKFVIGNKRLYVPVNLRDHKKAIIKAREEIKRYIDGFGGGVKINIAGNGVYTCVDYGFNQGDVDSLISDCLEFVFADIEIIEVRSGGQTGVDEAGLKWALRCLGLTPVICHFPRGWLFRDINDNDIWNPKAFKNRFAQAEEDALPF